MNDSPNLDVVLFAEALQMPVAERAAYLEKACGGDRELRQHVEALLQGHDQLGDFLEEFPQRPTLGYGQEASTREMPGDRIGHFKLLEQIGEGGCGVVFMAEQEAPIRRLVALKVIKPGMDTKSVIARFAAERQALALMDHPNIAKIFDAGATDSGRPYFVMELVRGIKITDYCDEHFLTTEARLDLFVQVCQAVQHAHQKGIIHRDIKPSNILVTQTLEGAALPVVIDFGIAKATSNLRLTEKTLFTAFEMFIGTPAYMSPEQAALTSVDVDTRTDIYSLGILLYELLTGSPPYDTGELLKAGLDEIRRVIREQEPARPSTRLSKMTGADLTALARCRMSEAPTLIRSIRGDLDWIAMKALEKDRTRRYETVTGLKLDVQRYLAKEPILARPPSTLYKLQKTFQRNKVFFIGIGATALLLIVGLIVVSVSLAKERQSRREAEFATLKSNQTSKFLESLLIGVGPSTALGRDTTMLREILDQTAERVGKEMSDQPAVEAELRNLIGTLYRRIGNNTGSEEMHRKALAIRRKLFGPQSLEAAASLNDLGLAFLAQKKLVEAEEVGVEAVAIRRRLLGNQNADTARSINDLGAVYREDGRLKEANALAKEALGIRQKLFGKESLEVADSLRNLCIILGNERKWAESEAMAREVLAMRRKLLGPDHPWVASALQDLAWALGDRGKLEEVEALQREALAMRRKLLPEEHPDVAESLRLVGDTMRERGNLNEAHDVLSAALSIQRKLLGDDAQEALLTMHRLGLTLEAGGNWSDAEVVHREALALWRKKVGNEDPRALYALSDLGQSLEGQKKWSEAEAVRREAVALWGKQLGMEAPQTLYALRDLAKTLEGGGKWHEAETLHRETLAVWRKVAGNEDSQTLYTIHRLGLALEKLGKWAESEALHREALALWRKHLGNEHPKTLYAMRDLAATLESEGKWAEVEILYREELAAWRKRAGNEDPQTLYVLGKLGFTLEAQSKWPEAETVYRETLILQRKLAGDDDPQTLLAMHKLGLAFEGQRKWQEAEDVHRDAVELWRKRGGDADAQTLYAQRNLAASLEGAGKWSEAETVWRESLAMWRKQAGDEDPQTLYTRRKLGMVLEAESKWSEAETLYAETLALARKRAGNEDAEALADLEGLVRVLMAQRKFAEAERRLGEVLTPTFVKQPASAKFLAQRVDVMGRQRRWKEAAVDAGLLLQLQPDDHYHHHRMACLLAVNQNLSSYEQLCRKISATFTNTTNPYVAERMAQDCLLLPNSGVNFGWVDKMADFAVKSGNDDASLPYFQACKAMSNYRQGHFSEAIEWGDKALKSSLSDGHAKAKAYAISAMAHWRIGRKDAARAMLGKGDALVPSTLPPPNDVDIGGSWVAWLMARISLDEATALIQPGPKN